MKGEEGGKRGMDMKWLLVVVGFALMGVGSARGQAQGNSINLRDTVVVEVVRRTKEAVVNIAAQKMVLQRVSAFGSDPFFQRFGPSEIVQRQSNSLGSGFIIHSDGYVVTNNHVIDQAREISVELSDGRKLAAELISADPEADLAVLKISDPKPFPVLDLGDSSDLMIGEPAIAVGNPLGYSHTVSTGIVSALHRDLKSNQGTVTLGDLIQTDAAINPGNSGGPLLNAYGQVIGINTAIRQDAQNIGFAIQVNRLRDLIPELMNPAQATKVDVPLRLAERRTLTPPSRIACAIVTADKPARQVESINGQAFGNIVDVYAMLLGVKSGEKLTVRFDRGGDEVVTAKSVPRPDALVQAEKRLGLTVEPLTPMMADKYKLGVQEGLLVKQVSSESIAAHAGIQSGDVITSLGRHRVASLDDLSVLLQHLPASGRVPVGIVRGDEPAYGWLTFGANTEEQ